MPSQSPRNSLPLLLAALAGWAGILFAPQLAAQSPNPSPTPIEVLVDGKPLAPTGTQFRVPASHQSVSIRLGRPAENADLPGRMVRFKLEGVDTAWRQVPSEMSLIVRFTDGGGDQVGQHIVRVSGTSRGWKGSIERSSFIPRREVARVPPWAYFVTVAISSSGPPTAVGVYVVRDLRIWQGNPDSLIGIFSAKFPNDPTGAVPPGWRRSGTRPSMASMVPTASGQAFCLVDDDPNAHAEWLFTGATRRGVTPGELLTVEWSEMHHIGEGNRFTVNYGRLNAGAYRMLAREEAADGRLLAGQATLEFVVLQPFWKKAWFLAGATITLGGLLWAGFRIAMRREIRQHLARAEQEHLIERERLRIARDLHDDLGARLTHISLVSGLAENDPQSAPVRESLQRISGMTRELVAALYQTVWTVNPENDHLEALLNFLCQLAQKLCEAAGIRCRIHSCAAPPTRRVTSEVRHNITLAVKEALHNAIKHAGATEITTHIDFADPRLVITIEDNGTGFDAATVTPGSGLTNMRRRMDAIGGAMTVVTSPGTRIRFEVPIP